MLLIREAKSREGRGLNKKGRLDGVKRRARAKIKSARGEVKGTNQLPVLWLCPSWRTAGFKSLMPIWCYWKHVSQLARRLGVLPTLPFILQRHIVSLALGLFSPPIARPLSGQFAILLSPLSFCFFLFFLPGVSWIVLLCLSFPSSFLLSLFIHTNKINVQMHLNILSRVYRLWVIC